MRLKSFHGPTQTDAMRAVREALGENAIIVATREDETGGVRVTAAIDDITAASPGRALPALPDGSEALEKIADCLTYHHIYPPLAEKLMAAATQFANEDPLLALGAALDVHFKFSPVAQDKPVLFIGPPGGGKTLCTAKFATQTTLAKRKATVVSTDTDRAGGMEQLSAFTRLLNLNLVEIDDWHALRDLLTIENAHPVYIDTAGCNPYDADEKRMARDYVAAVGDATLVLPASLDGAEGTDMALEFRSLGASRLLVTQRDMVKRVGNFLRIAFETKLPFANYSASDKVTAPLQPLNPVVLARMILKKNNAQEEPANERHPEPRRSAL